jgi:hypothetical protein
MARTKEPVAAPFDPWAEYQRLQLTPEQKAAARKYLEAQGEEAARNGIWELFLELEGKVHLDMDDLRRARGKGEPEGRGAPSR